MKRESPYSSHRFVRELQYAWTLHFLNLQYAMLGNSDRSILIEKGFLSGLKNIFGGIREKFFGSLLKTPEFHGDSISINIDSEFDYSLYKKDIKKLEFPEGTVQRDQLEEADQAIFDFFAHDWNQIYEEHREKASLIGYIAEYMTGNGYSEDDIKDMSIPELSNAYSENFEAPGIDEIENMSEVTGLDKDRLYAYLYAESKGAEWLAIYDDDGNRSGRAYELITKMYRKQIAEAMLRDAPISEIRSIMISPDDDEIKEALGLFDDNLPEFERRQREEDYEELVRTHLNRDMQRFAYTETMINYNNGKLLRMAHESKNSGSPVYVRFGRM